MNGRGVLAAGWVGCLLVLAVAAAPVAVPPAVRFLPFAASFLLFGLPHGAADHLVPAWFGAAPPGRSAAAVGLLYAVLGGAYAAVWPVAPVVAFAAFIALTWYHWGQGDLHAMAAFAGDAHLRSRFQRALAVAVRGGLPMVVPFVAFPAVYRRVAAATVGLFGATVPDWVFAPGSRWLAGLGFGALTAAALSLGFVRARGAGAVRDWLADTAETLLLGVYFASVSPVLAVGIYFTLWHSMRHVARLATAADPDAGTRAALRSFARAAAPLTAVSLAALGAVAAFAPPATLLGALGVYLVGLAVLTAPHAALVTWMDRREGVWVG